MTIISNTGFLPLYPFRKIPEVVVQALHRHASKEAINVPLKLLECYLQITDTELSYLQLSSQSCESTIVGFVVAVRSESFIKSDYKIRLRWAKRFLEALDSLRCDIPGLPKFDYLLSDFMVGKELWDLQQKNINPKTLRYWNGWRVTSLKGLNSYLALGSLWNSHGSEFTEEYFKAWKDFGAKQARPNNTMSNKFTTFLSKHAEEWPVTTFRNPYMLKRFFLALMKDFFLSSHRDNLDIPCQIKTWNRFMTNCEEAFIQPSIWPTPAGDGLPRPNQPNGAGPIIRISRNQDGVDIHEKLITPVPMEVTDDDAIEILFKSIHTDISIIKNWATTQADELYSRAERRINTSAKAKEIRQTRRKYQKRSYEFESICAIFKTYGFPASRSAFAQQYGHEALSSEIAHSLGLPAAGSLYPYQMLMIAEHNEITPSFLDGFRLYDDNGRRTGFVKTDSRYQLVGFKDRRGGKLSQQKIQLSTQTTKRVMEIIKITTPLRNHLKKIGDNQWRELFLTCGKGMALPRRAKAQPWCDSLFKNHPHILKSLELQFSKHTHLRGAKLRDFLIRVTPSSLRASCAVAVYLKTQSVEEMSKALGHANHSHLQLSHYLPEPILAFFQARWIRIFQRGIICDAMKGSSHLIEAANFKSIEELNTFLKNHALKDVPEHLLDPENSEKVKPKSVDSYSEVYISIDPKIMTTLVSLERAVALADRPDKVTGLARYWADLTKVVTAEIRRDNDGLLKSHLNIAEKHCNPSRMESLIYGE